MKTTETKINKSELFKSAWFISKSLMVSFSDALKMAWSKIKKTFLASDNHIKELRTLTKSDIFNMLQKVGFCREYNGRYFSERTELQYIVLDFVNKHSKGFQSDIAKKANEYKISDKQAWCVAFEFDKLKLNI
jgi:hypothetical protein